MPAHIKVMRLLGAVFVTLALVPWLGISPAAATEGGGGKPDDKGSSAAKGSDKGKADDHAEKADSNSSGSSGNQKVTLCHRTNSDSNPYVTITVSISSVIKHSGHDGHQGPVYAAGMKSAKQKWGDIIPAFSHPGGSYAGKNWPGGRSIYDAGCQAETGGGETTTPPPSTSTPSTPGGGTQMVTLCHRTNSETNPYVRITVSISSVVKGHGHDGHAGPVFEAGMKSAKQKWGDIIPSFTYPTAGGSSASYGGKNWPSGQAIFNAGCALAQPTTTTSVSPTTSTSVSPTTSTSVNPSDTGTVTTTVTSPTGTTTSDTSVLPTKIGPEDDDDTGVLGGRTGVLPRTGLTLPIGAALGLSLLLLLAGGWLLVVPVRTVTESNRRH